MIAAASEFHALDLSRNTNPHVGFAAGIHYCLGAPLARMEIAVALTRLPARASGIEMLRPPERRKLPAPSASARVPAAAPDMIS